VVAQLQDMRHMARITKRTVDALKPGQIAWDDELKGFGARRRGDMISYVAKYRAGRGRGARQRWYLIGRHGAPWTALTAREQAVRILMQARLGGDPAADQRQQQYADTVASLWALYHERVATPSKKARSVAEDEALARDYILPVFGNRSVREIVRADVARWHASFAIKPARANRALALFRAMLNRAEAWGMRPEHSNPAARIEKFKERPRERYMNASELERLGAAMNDFDARRACPPQATALLRLLLLTGMRLGEGLTLRWNYVDLEARAIRLPHSKTGAKSIPLASSAWAVLAGLRRENGAEFVFPGSRGDRPMQGIQNIWQRIRLAANLKDVRIHDLRHGFASVAVQAGESLYLVGKVLGHRQSKTTERYAHVSTDPMRPVAESAAKRIDAALRGETAQLIPMRSRSSG